MAGRINQCSVSLFCERLQFECQMQPHWAMAFVICKVGKNSQWAGRALKRTLCAVWDALECHKSLALLLDLKILWILWQFYLLKPILSNPMQRPWTQLSSCPSVTASSTLTCAWEFKAYNASSELEVVSRNHEEDHPFFDKSQTWLTMQCPEEQVAPCLYRCRWLYGFGGCHLCLWKRWSSWCVSRLLWLQAWACLSWGEMSHPQPQETPLTQLFDILHLIIVLVNFALLLPTAEMRLLRPTRSLQTWNMDQSASLVPNQILLPRGQGIALGPNLSSQLPTYDVAICQDTHDVAYYERRCAPLLSS